MRDNAIVVAGQVNPALTAAIDVQIELRLDNEGDAVHNFHVSGTSGFSGAFCKRIDETDPCSQPVYLPGGSNGVIAMRFTTPGSYEYRCDFHPDEMRGLIRVE